MTACWQAHQTLHFSFDFFHSKITAHLLSFFQIATCWTPIMLDLIAIILSSLFLGTVAAVFCLLAEKEKEKKRFILIQRTVANFEELGAIQRKEISLLQEKSTLEVKRTSTGSLSQDEIISLLKLEIDLRAIKSDISANRGEFAEISREVFEWTRTVDPEGMTWRGCSPKCALYSVSTVNLAACFSRWELNPNEWMLPFFSFLLLVTASLLLLSASSRFPHILIRSILPPSQTALDANFPFFQAGWERRLSLFQDSLSLLSSTASCTCSGPWRMATWTVWAYITPPSLSPL